MVLAFGTVTDPKAFLLTLLMQISRCSSEMAFLQIVNKSENCTTSIPALLTSSANRHPLPAQLPPLASSLSSHSSFCLPSWTNLRIFEGNRKLSALLHPLLTLLTEIASV